MDFSKCQCPHHGWCDLLKKEMTYDPPNWQWCQSLSGDQRESYYHSLLKSSAGKIIQKANNANEVDIVSFYDELPDQSSDYAVCVIPSNNYAMDLLNISRDSIQAYAKKYGADYIELTGDQNPNWPMANKYRVYHVTSKYKKTLYLDCDILIKDNAPDIFKITPDDKISAYEEYEIFSMPNGEHFQWVRNDYEIIIGKYLPNNHSFVDNGKICFPDQMINGGVLVIPNSEAHYYKQPEYPYPKTWCFDQQFLTVLLHRDNKFFNLDKKWNFEFIRHDFWEKNHSAYFLHFNAARPDSYRQTVMQRFKAGNTIRYTQRMNESIHSIQWLKPESKHYFSIFEDHDDNPPKSKVNKNLIITVASGKEYENILKLTGRIFRKYAKKCNADYIQLTGTTQEFGYFEKFRIYPFVKQYNRTLFLDADLIVLDDAPNLFDVVPEDSIGIHCDYQSVYNNGDGVNHLTVFDSWKLNTAKSLFSPAEVNRYLQLSDKKLFNSGVVLCPREYADIWMGIYKPCIKNFLVEQYTVEMRMLLHNYKIFELEDAWNMQVWMPNSVFFKKDVKKYFMHLAGWRNLYLTHQDIGRFFIGIPMEEMVKKVINEEIYIYS